ncbi:MAG TPA: Mur ligase family protein [Actinomycetota bacterium]|nr:Mur ligase family protein [Actinomycetota bacterium]
MTGADPVRLLELRVLDGPNLYFTRPAIKLTLALPGWMELPERRAVALGERVGLVAVRRPAGRPGPPGTEHRRRFLARVAAQVTRQLARAAGVRLAVRARPGDGPDRVVVAFPWRRRALAEALGREVADLLGSLLRPGRRLDAAVRAHATRLEGIDPGPTPAVPVPEVPVVAVTGTNGKTTTVRLLAHVLASAGLRVAYTSTDGVYVDGRLVEEGDYSGPAGAAMALSQESVEAVILEVARGGILLKGIGTAHNDVAVVTNVSADHLDLQGIRTLDQLAEVKATITRITRPEGWAVLNADDPRVLAMRRVATGRPFLFSMDPDHPAIRSALQDGGLAMAPLDRELALFTPGPAIHPLLPLEEVPATLAGISSHHVQNVLAAAAAAIGLGVDRGDLAEGLRSFVLDPERNPGRGNLFELDGRVVVVDYAHNEAGMAGLVEIARGLLPTGGRVWLAFGSAGDRTDQILHGLGYVAARGADRVVVAELHRYLRGRQPEDVVRRLVDGARDGGARDVPVVPDELHALGWMFEASAPGDVVAVNALGQRPEILAELRRRGARRVGPARCRQLVRRARRGVR